MLQLQPHVITAKNLSPSLTAKGTATSAAIHFTEQRAAYENSELKESFSDVESAHSATFTAALQEESYAKVSFLF